MRGRVATTLLVAALAVRGVSAESGGHVTIGAAAVFTDAVGELARSWEERSGMAVRVTIGSSGALRAQIMQGAPIDVFLMGNEEEARELVKAGHADERWVTPLCRNSLVVLVHPGHPVESPGSLLCLLSPEIRRIAVPNLQTTASGKYLSRVFEHERALYEGVRDKFFFAETVRQALLWFQMGNADAAVVFRSDVAGIKDAEVAHEILLVEGRPIVQVCGLTRRGLASTRAKDLYAFLTGREAGQILSLHGFIVE